MRDILISASLLAADGTQLGKEARAIEQAGVDWLHIDVMDGHFVPQITWGAWILKALRPWTTLPFDVHLMVQDPCVDPYIEAGAHMITFHPESVSHPEDLLHAIKAKKCKAGLAISPGHDYTQWPYHWWSLCDAVTLMSVEPGMGGQSFRLETASILNHIKCTYPAVPISVDGGINPFSLPYIRQADILVSGSFLFSSPFYQDNVNFLRKSFCGIKEPTHPILQTA